MNQLPKYVSDRINLDDIIDRMLSLFPTGKYIDRGWLKKRIISKSHHYKKELNPKPFAYFATMTRSYIMGYLHSNKEEIERMVIEERRENREKKLKDLFNT